ncbi:MAG: hypothetical protein F4128_13685 [Gammaproteobacteria bacterium]|nr:hypothetical protein [Gammaproteobacteria bacterium]
MKRRDFKEGDIAGLAEYLDEHRRSTMQPVLDQIDARFDQMVSKKEAWIFVAILIGVAIVLPEALEKIFDLIRALQGVAEPPSVSS